MTQQLPPPGAGQTSVTVTLISPGTGQLPDGSYGPGKRVSYQLGSGHQGTVFIPDRLFTRDYVQQAVMADAANLNDIAGLNFTV